MMIFNKNKFIKIITMGVKKEFINYLFELRGRTQYEIDTIKKLYEQKCSILEAGGLRGRLEILEDVIRHIDEIIKKYLKTHIDN